MARLDHLAQSGEYLTINNVYLLIIISKMRILGKFNLSLGLLVFTDLKLIQMARLNRLAQSGEYLTTNNVYLLVIVSKMRILGKFNPPL
jgi:hypothetical protein